MSLQTPERAETLPKHSETVLSSYGQDEAIKAGTSAAQRRVSQVRENEIRFLNSLEMAAAARYILALLGVRRGDSH